MFVKSNINVSRFVSDFRCSRPTSVTPPLLKVRSCSPRSFPISFIAESSNTLCSIRRFLRLTRPARWRYSLDFSPRPWSSRLSKSFNFAKLRKVVKRSAPGTVHSPIFRRRSIQSNRPILSAQLNGRCTIEIASCCVVGVQSTCSLIQSVTWCGFRLRMGKRFPMWARNDLRYRLLLGVIRLVRGIMRQFSHHWSSHGRKVVVRRSGE
jgi:hypothetical protein